MDISWTETEQGIARGGAGVAMARRAAQYVLFVLVMLSGFVAMSQSAAAAPPAPPFTQCEPVGQDHTCGSLLVVNADRSVSVYSDPSVGPYEGADDTLVGIENQSSQPVSAIVVYGQTPLFAFDGDGLCTQSPRPTKCPFGTIEYEGPETTFVMDPTSQNGADGEVDFAGSGIAPGEHRYFSLESAVTSATLKVLVGRLASCPEAGQWANGYPRAENYQGTHSDHAGLAEWKFEYGVSKCEGLVVTNVRLGERLMAERMSLPYLDLATCTGPNNTTPQSVSGCTTHKMRHIVLRESENEPQADPSAYTKVHLIKGPVVFEAKAPTYGPCYSAAPCNHIVIEAKYQVDLAPPTGNPVTDSFLTVTQKYEFYEDFDEGHDFQLACEPAHGLGIGPVHSPLALEDCGRWKPLIEYAYHPGNSGEILERLNAAERLHFTPDAVAVRGESFFRDCDEFFPTNGCLGFPGLGKGFEDGPNPLPNETAVRAFSRSDTPPFNTVAGRYDNLHLTGSDKVGAPAPPPGCGPCVHMHWRWGMDVAKKAEDAGAPSAFAQGFPQLKDSQPEGVDNPFAKQTLDVGVVTYHADELSPRNFMELIRGANPTDLNMKIVNGQYQGGIATGTDTLNYGPAGCYDASAIASWGQCGVVVWLSATAYGENIASNGEGEEDHDSFFAFSGFFCAKCSEPDYADFLKLKPKYAPSGNMTHIKGGHPLAIMFGNLESPFAGSVTFGGDLKILDLLPAGMAHPVVTTTESSRDAPIRCALIDQGGRTELNCDVNNDGTQNWPCVFETCITVHGNLSTTPGQYDNVARVVWQERNGEHIAGNMRTIEPITIGP